jgi:tetratricopeptide (TPR) repeat protein
MSMIIPETLQSILERIAQHQQTADDLEVLRRSIHQEGKLLQWVSQDGKFNTNIGQISGGEFHFGDRIYQGADASAIQAILQEALQTLSHKVEPTGIPENLPRSGVRQFVGRKLELEALHRQLQQNECVSISAIAGMGGVGKTELALQYALNYKHTYQCGICWLQAKGTDVGSQIVQFGRSHLQLNPSDELNLPAQVGFCWTYWPKPDQSLTGENRSQADVLIVLDDVTSYEVTKPFLPPAKSRFKVLLTTRLRLGCSVQLLEVDVLSEFAALELLESLITPKRVQSELETARQLCNWLGYLPLGLELVGRYLARKPDLSLVSMQERLEKKRLGERSLNKLEVGMTSELGVGAAFDLSWETLSEPAKQLACLLSLCALAPIPWSLVEQTLSNQDSDELEDIRDDSLSSLHLIQRVGGGVYRLHQLIREFLQEKLERLDQAGELKRALISGMATVARQIPPDPTVDHITTFSPIISHLLEASKALNGYAEEQDLTAIFLGVGNFYQGQEFYAEADSWFQHCLEVTQKRWGTDHPLLVTLSNQLAHVYHHQGRYAEAEILLLQTLELGKAKLGAEHTEVAAVLHTLGCVYESQGRYAKAEPTYREALAIQKQLLGSEHPEIAKSLHILAKFYLNQDRFAEAMLAFEEALAMRQKLFGREHPRVAATLSNLAKLYTKQGRELEAESILVEVLAMQKRLLGEEHLNISFTLTNLSKLYTAQKRYAEAEALLIQALTIRKKMLGDKHRYVGNALAYLAKLYSAQGNASQAQPLYVQALEISEHQLGSVHPDTIKLREAFISER